jgi:hypothetical protein
MNPLIKTFILFMTLSLILFSILYSFRNSQKIFIRSKIDQSPKETNFREFLNNKKIMIFTEMEENWCMKFNCNSR